MARKKKVEPVEKVLEESQQVTLRKHEYYFAVTEDEYEAHREELEKMDNIVIFVDDVDMYCWLTAKWHLNFYA